MRKLRESKKRVKENRERRITISKKNQIQTHGEKTEKKKRDEKPHSTFRKPGIRFCELVVSSVPKPLVSTCWFGPLSSIRRQARLPSHSN